MASVLGFFFLLSASVSAGEIFTDFPSKIDPDARYLFYSHGFIVEGENPKPVHGRWGVYDYPEIKQSLAAFDSHLIAYHRSKGTDPLTFARSLAEQTRRLIDAGVKPENIGFVGFSRGGAITVLVSSLLQMSEIRFVILAGCGTVVDANTSIQLHGRVLSIREASDDLVGSCDPLAARSVGLVNYKEMIINTRLEHGAFYKPLKEWTQPVRQWLEQ